MWTNLCKPRWKATETDTANVDEDSATESPKSQNKDENVTGDQKCHAVLAVMIFLLHYSDVEGIPDQLIMQTR